MLFMLLFIMLCLLDTSKTKQFHPGDDYVQIVSEYYRPLSAATASAWRANGAGRHQVEARHQLGAPMKSQLSTSRHQVPAALANQARAQPSHERRSQTLAPLALDFVQRPAEGDANQQSRRQKQASSPAPKLTRINRNVSSHKQLSRSLIKSSGAPSPAGRPDDHVERHQHQQHIDDHEKQRQQQQREQQQQHQHQREQQQQHQHQRQQQQGASATNSRDRDLNQGQLTVNYHRHHEQKNKRAAVEKSANDLEPGSISALSSSSTSAVASVSHWNDVNLGRSNTGAGIGNGNGNGSISGRASSGGGGGGAEMDGDGDGDGDTIAMASSASLSSSAPPSKSLAEDPVLSATMLDSSLAESLDFVGNDLGGHFDYAYQPAGREPAFTVAAASQQQAAASAAASNNSTMALYRLLNLIEQSARPQAPLHLTQPPISIPLPSAKISSPYISYAPISSGALVRVPSASQANQANFDNYNDYHYHTLANYNNKSALLNANHLFGGTNFTRAASSAPYPFAIQQPHQRPPHHAHHHTSSSFMPNHWSRKRNQMHHPNHNRNHNQHHHWRHQPDLAHTTNAFSPKQQLQQQQQPASSLFVDQNLIEVQPAAMKMIKASHAFASGSPRRNNSLANYSNGYERPSLHHAGGGHQNSSSTAAAAPASASNQNNLDTLNNNFNSLLNNDDIGFGNKQPPATQVHQPAQPPNNSFGQQAGGASGQLAEKLSGALTSSSLANSKVPHDADSEMIAANNAPRCDKFTPDICVDDFEYPEQAIIDEIQKKRDVFELMYSEVKDNEPLVDGIPRDVEESYNYDYYYYGKTNLSQAASQPSASQTTPPPPPPPPSSANVGAGLRLTPMSSDKLHRSSATNSMQSADTLDGSLAARASSSAIVAASAGIDGMDALIGTMPQATNPQASQSPPTTGYICPSEVMYGKPKLAKNKKGLWKVIVNAGEFTQTVRLEKCLFPNKKCNYVSAQSYESRCAQVHSYHRLLVFEKGRGFYIDTFRLPTGCNCFVSRKPFTSSASSSSGSSVSSASSRRDSTSSQESTGSQSDSPPTSRANGRLPALLGDSSLSSSFNGGNTGHRDVSSSSRGPSSESMLSQTLWSILSGGGGGGASSASANNGLGGPQHNVNSYQNYEPQASSDSAGGHGASGANYNSGTWPDGGQTAPFEKPSSQREAYQSQSLILEHLSQNPALAANISDSVLRQLIDVGQISGGGGGGGGGTGGPSSTPHGSQYQHQHHPHSAYAPHHAHDYHHHNHHQYQSQQNRPPPYRRRR